MCLAQGVPAGDQGDGLLVVHGHAAERLADVIRGGERVRHAVRALGVDVDEPHVGGAQGAGKLLAVLGETIASEPDGLDAHPRVRANPKAYRGPRELMTRVRFMMVLGLVGFPWPGNVREFHHTVVRATVLVASIPIRSEHLSVDPFRGFQAREASQHRNQRAPHGLAQCEPRFANGAAKTFPEVGRYRTVEGLVCL